MKKWYRQLGMILVLVLLLSNSSLFSVNAAETGDTVDQHMEKNEKDFEQDSSEENTPNGADETEEMVDSDEKADELNEDVKTVDETGRYSTESKDEQNKVEEENPYSAEQSGLENSWRYQEGELMPQKLRYIEYSTWPNDEDAVAYGIDVSYHNGTIDWAKVKKAGVDFAIIRCGYGMNLETQDDVKWMYNVQGCIENDIPFGVYIYSYADTQARAKSEAEHVLRLVEGYDLDYPIYFDMEEDELLSKLTKKQLGDIAETFCNTIEAAGYEVGIYANTNWFTNYLTDSRFSQWEKWVAQYNTSCEYKGDYSMWQCSSKGKVDGISGYVDLNVDYGASIAGDNISGTNGFYKSPADDEWYYYKNGVVQKNLNDIINGTVDGTNGWWVIEDGKVSLEYTGFAENHNGWWYCKGSKVQFDTYDIINGTVDGIYGWWVIEDGKVSLEYTGFAENHNGWWYCKGSKVQFDTYDIINGTIDGIYGWWMIEDGKVSLKYTGFAENHNGWWYCKGSKVQFDTYDIINGTVDGTYGWWVIEDGKVSLKYTGFAENHNGWWYCKGSKVQFDTYDIINGTIDGTYSWWVIENGKVSLEYTGFAENHNGWWYCKGSKVQFDTYDIINGTVDGTYGWWYIADGKVTFVNTVAKNKNGWWVIQNGKVNFEFNGIASNSNGSWLCQNGKVNFDYNGVYKLGNITYRISGGKVTSKS